MAQTDQTAGSSTRNPALIRMYLGTVVKEVVEAISADEFRTTIGTLDGKPAVVQKLYEMQQAAILGDVHQTIDYMCTETGTEAKYNEITRLSSVNVNTDVQSWRPTTGDCAMQLYAHRRKILAEKKQTLEKLVEEERRSRMRMKSALDHQRSLFNKQRKQVASAQEKLHVFYDNLKSSNS